MNFKFTGNAGDFFWDFGDPATNADTSLSMNPEYLYPDTGYYKVRLVTRGCISSDTFDTTVYVPPLPPRPSFSLSETLRLGCGDSLVLQPSNDRGGTYYKWSTGDVKRSITVTEPGAYLLRYENDECFSVDTVNVLPNAGGGRYVDTAFLCERGETLFWRGRNLSQEGLFSEFSGDALCRDTFQIQVVDRRNTEQIKLVFCPGDTLELKGNRYFEPTNFTEKHKNRFGCDSILEYTLDTLPRSFTEIRTSVCALSPIVFGGKEIKEKGVYRDTLTALNGCKSYIALFVDEVILDRDTARGEICALEIADWPTSRIDSLNRSDTLESVVGGCASVKVFETNILIPEKTRDTLLLCPPYRFRGLDVSALDSVVDTVATGGTCPRLDYYYFKKPESFYTVSNTFFCQGESIETAGKTYTSAGTYFDTLTASNGCDSVLELNISEQTAENISITGPSTLCPSEFLATYSVADNRYRSIAWSIDKGMITKNLNNKIEVLWEKSGSGSAARGTVFVEVSDSLGCPIFAEQEVVLQDSLSQYLDPIEDCERVVAPVEVPNAVSPDGDGRNDFFKIKGIEYLRPLKLEVYDRWGRKVYSSPDYRNDWQPIRSGTYFYLLQAPNFKQKGFLEALP